MPVQGSDLKWYRAYMTDEGAATASPLTGETGGSIRDGGGNELSNTVGTVMRNVSGTDIAALGLSDSWYDYKKVYVKNNNASNIELINTAVTCTPDGVSNLDIFSVGVGLTDTGYYVDDSGTTAAGVGQEDYQEDGSGTTPEDSPFVRSSGGTTSINSLNGASALVVDYDAIEAHKTSYAGAFKLRITPLPDAQEAGTDAKYVKVVGQNGTSIVVGYIDLEGYDDTPATYVTAVVDRNWASPGADQTFTRIYSLSIHTKTYEDGGTQTVTTDPTAGREGDLTYIQVDAGTGTVVFEANTSGNVTQVARMYTCSGTDIGQCFATCFFPETAISTSATALLLPSLDPNPGATELNEYYDMKQPHHALWIRRYISKTASSASNITNRFSFFGDSV